MFPIKVPPSSWSTHDAMVLPAAAGFVDFVSFSLQSVSSRRRGGMADTSDLKSEGVKTPCGFESRRRQFFRHKKTRGLAAGFREVRPG